MISILIKDYFILAARINLALTMRAIWVLVARVRTALP